jgi:hypothetical protein
MYSGGNVMQKKTISTCNDLFSILDEYNDKGFYFRGEIKDHNKTACLPDYLRDSGKKFTGKAIDSEILKQKLEELGVGFPYTPPADDSTQSNIKNVLMSSYDKSFFKWGEDKLEALMSHYSPDFKALDELTKKPGHEQYGRLFSSKYLDITSDIMVALHFACSKYCFLSTNKESKSNEQEEIKDGFLFVFDLKEIEKTEFLKLVSYPSYSYFFKEKEGDKLYFQPFDRITHQRGAFLAPKRNEKEEVCYDKLKEEIKSCLHTKITIKSDFKKKLYEIFEKGDGMEYYFPKIPYTFGNEIQQAYKKLKGTTSCF